MKIALVLDDSLDRSDGVQQYVLTVGSWLRGQGHTVHYLVGQTKRRDLTHIHSLSRNIGVRFNQNRLSIPLPASLSDIRNILTTELFDVVHVQMPYSPMLGARVIRLCPPTVAVVGTFHIMPYSRLEQGASKMLSWWLQGTLKRFDTVLSVSPVAQLFANSGFGLQSVVVPNAIDVDRFRQGIKLQKYDDATLTILFLGRLVERKGCMELLRALTLFKQRSQVPKLRLLICGTGPLEQALQSYVRRHALVGLVEFTGFIAEVAKPNYLASADVAVFPSLGGESFGIVLLEAMAAGASVVLGGNNAGYRSVLQDQPSLLINPRDTFQFAERLQLFLQDAALRKHIQAWQQREVQRYDINSVGPAILQSYAQAIAKRARSRDN